MSPNVIDAVLYYSIANDIKLGLIPTRRQVDTKYAYVMDTTPFVEYVRARSDNIILERDHAGPDQGMINDNGVDSLLFDTKCRFDIIHLDPFKKHHKIDMAASWTINMINQIQSENDLIRFEVGTEEAIRPYSLKELMVFIDLLGNILDKVEYIVVQTGTKIDGIGNKNLLSKPDATKMIEFCHSWGIKAKEHNGDFLPEEGFTNRFDWGLDAINIGPELGILETTSILDLVSKDDARILIDIFSDNRKWQRWLPSTSSKLERATFTGHYSYNKSEFLKVKCKYPNLNHNIIQFLMEKIDARYTQCVR